LCFPRIVMPYIIRHDVLKRSDDTGFQYRRKKLITLRDHLFPLLETNIRPMFQVPRVVLLIKYQIRRWTLSKIFYLCSNMYFPVPLSVPTPDRQVLSESLYRAYLDRKSVV